MATRRLVRALVVLASAGLGAIACVNLFHSTDFATLCVVDAAACAPEAAPPDAIAPAALEAAAPIDFCTLSADDAKAHAARACAWLGACLGTRVEATFGSCMIQALAAYDCRLNPSLRPRGHSAETWSCLGDVASCDGVERCLFGALTPGCGSANGGDFISCSADRPPSAVVECSSAGPAVEPCALEARGCTSNDAGTACTGAQGTTCEGGPTCNGTQASTCNGNLDIGLDCAALGAGSCVADDAGAACAPLDDAGSCSESSAVECDDAGVATSCVGGRPVRIDCSVLGAGCDPGRALPIRPIGACTEPNPDAKCVADECRGDVLHSCGQDKAFEVACSSVGLGACVLGGAVGRAPACSVK